MAAADTVRAAEVARAVPALAPRAVAARVAGIRAGVARRAVLRGKAEVRGEAVLREEAVLRDGEAAARLTAPVRAVVRAAPVRAAVARGAAVRRVAEVRAAVLRTWLPATDFVLPLTF